MTPENGLLSVERLQGIRSAFGERGIRTAAVFLMRDPVDRVWSQVRMQHARTPERFSESPEETLLRVHAEESYDSRTRYDAIVGRLDASLPEDDIAYAFYEELFEAEEVRRICDILGIDFLEPDLDLRANVSAVESDGLAPETVRVVADHYREVYEFVERRFGVDLERLWPNSRHLG